MRAVLVNAPDSLLEERRRLGLDKQDECWNGEWHLVHPPKRWHTRLNTDLLLALAPLARRAGLDPYGDSTGLFTDVEHDWRVPDQVYARPEHGIDEGVTGADLVVEIRSPGDESYAKLPFYAARGVTEVLVVHEDRRFELYRLDDERGFVLVDDGSGVATSAVLGVSFSTVDGRLGLDWDDGSVRI